MNVWIYMIKQRIRIMKKTNPLTTVLMTDGLLSDVHLLIINLCSNICQCFLNVRLPSQQKYFKNLQGIPLQTMANDGMFSILCYLKEKTSAAMRLVLAFHFLAPLWVNNKAVTILLYVVLFITLYNCNIDNVWVCGRNRFQWTFE